MNIDRALINEAADQYEIDPDILVALLNLSSEFPDMAAWGAKTRLLGRIAEVVEVAVEAHDR